MPSSSSTPSVSEGPSRNASGIPARPGRIVLTRARLGRAASALALAWLALALGSAGCAALRGSPPEDQAAGPSGSELWGMHCGRCHFNRSPSWYSDGQWDVAMFHMGVKAQLTRAEREAVLRYLEAANGP